jgi:hypothetical protein
MLRTRWLSGLSALWARRAVRMRGAAVLRMRTTVFASLRTNATVFASLRTNATVLAIALVVAPLPLLPLYPTPFCTFPTLFSTALCFGCAPCLDVLPRLGGTLRVGVAGAIIPPRHTSIVPTLTFRAS